jgi:hypothetical protein
MLCDNISYLDTPPIMELSFFGNVNVAVFAFTANFAFITFVFNVFV